jgi:hypothetical protein
MSSKQKNQAAEIRIFILTNVEQHPRSVVKETMDHFRVSRTTVNRHVNRLIKEEKLIQSGQTKNIQYLLPDAMELEFQYAVSPDLDEFSIFEKNFAKHLKIIDANLEDILSYVVTEMINNVKDHSQGKKLKLRWQRQALQQRISIEDDGIGLYKKLATFCKIEDHREVILHLSKGKLTTDPSNHTGEGIFFSSKVVDEFSITANGLKYITNNKESDWLITSVSSPKSGTTVEIIIENHPKQKLTSIFKAFQQDASLNFNVTEIKVELSKLGSEKYISRSQAKRILLGLEGFDVIILDFDKVRMIGQGFADEVFRVYQNKFPDKKINYINTNVDILFMIQRSFKRPD